MMLAKFSSKLSYVYQSSFLERVYGTYLIYIATKPMNIDIKHATKLYLSKNNALLGKISSIEDRRNIRKMDVFEPSFNFANITII